MISEFICKGVLCFCALGTILAIVDIIRLSVQTMSDLGKQDRIKQVKANNLMSSYSKSVSDEDELVLMSVTADSLNTVNTMNTLSQ